MAHILHLVPAGFYRSLAGAAPYLPEGFESEGFIHCTQGDELLLQVANQYYCDTPGDFLVLVIEEDKVTAPVKWETRGTTLFPHIYGPLNRDAVVNVVAVQRAPDGEFVGYEHALDAR
jgi:uncharacterized protein (DUF952 family)